jgi:hypothetical protein
MNTLYLHATKHLGHELKKLLGFEPVVINGPKIIFGYDDVYYENKQRRAYLVRGADNKEAKLNPKARDFVPSDLDKYQDEWK